MMGKINISIPIWIFNILIFTNLNNFEKSVASPDIGQVVNCGKKTQNWGGKVTKWG
jgi:hypothetical protein